MPNIPVYQAGEDAALAGRVNPQEGAAARLSTAGRMVGQMGREGAEYVQSGLNQAARGIGEGAIDYGKELERRQGAQEIMGLSGKMADAEIAYTQALNGAKTSADLGGARAAYEKTLSGLSEGLQTDRGRMFAAEHTAEARQRAAQQEIVHTGILEGAAARQMMFDTMQNADRAYALQPDEGGMQNGLAMLDRSLAAIEAAHPGMGAEQREALREKYQEQRSRYISGAVFGTMMNNPAEGRRLAAKYAGEFGPEVAGRLQERSFTLEREARSMAWQQEEHNYIRDQHAARGAYDEYLQNATIDRAAGRVTFSPDQTDAIRRDPRLSGEPGLRERLMEQGAKAELGGKPEDNPAVVGALQKSALLPEGDEHRLTIDQLNAVPLVGPGSISPERRKEISGILRGETFNDFEKAEIGRAQEGITNTLGSDVTNAPAVARAQLEQREFVMSAKRNGTSVADALRQWDQRYPTADKLTETFSKPAADAAAGAVAPMTQTQKAGQQIASLAGDIAGKLQNGASPQAISGLLERAGAKPIPPEDIASGRWCADFVNSVLSVYGVEGMQRSAASFRTWGNPVMPQDAKSGDVAVTPTLVPGTTGHAMIVLGPPAMHNGQLSVQTAGDSGVKWWALNSLVIRSYQASVPESFNHDSAKPGPIGLPGHLGLEKSMQFHFPTLQELLSKGGA